ncbi:MAG: prepilin-type N-terminal cleavage/methylation domain-containing protein [Planctomycetota bacterium]
MKHHLFQSAPCRRGFSLIEILVVVSIVALLIGISFPVALRMLAQASVSNTRSTLNTLGSAAAEFRTQTGGLPDHRDTTTGVAVNPPAGEDTTMGLFLSLAMQIQDCNQMVQSAAGKDGLAVTPAAGKDTGAASSASNAASTLAARRTLLESWVFIDDWETPMRYANGVSHTDGFTEDDYLPPHPNAFFASAGPDGEWGTHAADGTPDDEALDNLYSYNID